MRRTRSSIVLGMLICAPVALAQPPLPPGPDGQAGGALPEAPAPIANELEDAAAPQDGDSITLITGKTLTRVQVLRRTPAMLYVELAPGVPPMQIRLDQITDIVYDDVEPGKTGSAAGDKAPGGPGEVAAEPLAPELNENLGKQILNTPRNIPGRALTRVLYNLAKETGVPLEFSEAIKALPQDALLWTIDIPAGTTMRMLLETDVPRDFPQISVQYEFDKVIIDLKPENAG